MTGSEDSDYINLVSIA